MYLDNNLYERIEKITRTTYTNDFGEDDVWIDGDNICVLIEDLVCEVEHLQAKIINIKKDIEDNYQPIPIAKQVGISERDFCIDNTK